MPRPLRSLLLSTAILAGLSAMPMHARADSCPASTIVFLPPGPDPTSAPGATRSLTYSWAGGNGYASYDLTYGRLRATSIGDPDGGFGTHVRASDEYELIGPAGGPVTFSVRLYVEGDAEGRTDIQYPGGALDASCALLETGGAADSASIHASAGELLPFNPTLEIPLLHAIGEPFRLTFAAHTQGGFSTGHIVGHWSFIMPTGYAIQSCQGFAGSGATAVAARSWGRLKQRYR